MPDDYPPLRRLAPRPGQHTRPSNTSRQDHSPESQPGRRPEGFSRAMPRPTRQEWDPYHDQDMGMYKVNETPPYTATSSSNLSSSPQPRVSNMVVGLVSRRDRSPDSEQSADGSPIDADFAGTKQDFRGEVFHETNELEQLEVETSQAHVYVGVSLFSETRVPVPGGQRRNKVGPVRVTGHQSNVNIGSRLVFGPASTWDKVNETGRQKRQQDRK